MHCKEEATCRTHLSMGNPLGIKMVRTVPSVYCKDLVTPMVQLLEAASLESTSPGDKFAFVSETTLPVKPFAAVYAALTADQNSDICIEPRNEWLWLSNTKNRAESATLVKHSQWVVLNKDHARRLIRRWPHINGKSYAHWTVPLWPHSQEWGYSVDDFGKLPRDAALCTDEWAIF